MPGRLTGRTVPVASLDAAAVDAMWALLDTYYVDVERTRFEQDLSAKDRVILLEDGPTIVGFSTLTTYEGEVDGRAWVALYSGDTIIDRAWWGQTALQREFFAQLVRLWLRNLVRGLPTYWFLISKGYKTYLLLTRNWVHAWPVAGEPIPAFEARIIHHLGVRLFGPAYDPARGVVSFDRPMGRLREDVAPPDPDVDDRDIRYFLERNPGHVRGDELTCLGRMGWQTFLWFVLRHMAPVLRGRRSVRSGS